MEDLKFTYQQVRYRDLTKRVKRKQAHIPGFTKIETRMHNRLYNDERDNVKKTWCICKSQTTATLLIGLKKKDPLSGDVKITLKRKIVPYQEVYDPLA